MCMTVRTNGLNKSGSHATGHQNQSNSLVGSEWVSLCRKHGKLTRGKCPIREKQQYDTNDGGECRGKDLVVRDTLGNDGGDVRQRIDRDSSPSRHELSNNSKSVG